MVLAIVLIAVLLIFAFSLIIVSYNLYASQNKNLASARNMEAANTFSEALKEEMTEDDPMSGNLWCYIRGNIAYEDTNYTWADWPYYDPEGSAGHTKEYAYRYFTLEHNKDIEGFPAVMRLCVYWTLPDGMDGAAFQQRMANSSSGRSGIVLHLSTNAETASQEYQINDCYRLNLGTTSNEGEKLQLDAIASNYGHSINREEKWVWEYIGRE